MQTAKSLSPAGKKPYPPSAAKLAAHEEKSGATTEAAAPTSPPLTKEPPADALPSPTALVARAVVYPPITEEVRTHVPTAQAAFYLCRAQQTLRTYAMAGHPIRPVRVHGRLMWPMAAIRELLGVTQ